MSRVFSIARALKINHNGVMLGALNEVGDMIYGHELGCEDAEGSGYCVIDPTTLTFNTGFVDKDGDEIFTGDYLQLNNQRWELVTFDDDQGALCTADTNSYRFNDAGVTKCIQETRFYPLDRHRASLCRIVGNIYEKLLKADDTDET